MIYNPADPGKFISRLTPVKYKDRKKILSGVEGTNG
jgi:hypothetical protein